MSNLERYCRFNSFNNKYILIVSIHNNVNVFDFDNIEDIKWGERFFNNSEKKFYLKNNSIMAEINNKEFFLTNCDGDIKNCIKNIFQNYIKAYSKVNLATCKGLSEKYYSIKNLKKSIWFEVYEVKKYVGLNQNLILDKLLYSSLSN